MTDINNTAITPYFPCLRWKMGEYQAVMRLSELAKENITPLIEIPEIGFDFEAGRAAKTIDEHLEPFAKRVRKKWGKSKCMVDFRLIDHTERMYTGEHPLSYIFNDLREHDIDAIPVLRLTDDNDYKEAVTRELALGGRGVSLRIPITLLAQPIYKSLLDEVLDILEIPIDNINMIIDFESPSYEPVENFAQLVIKLLSSLPFYDQWKSIIILGTSFPPNLSGITTGLNLIPRHDWSLYQLIKKQLGHNRKLYYGDYGINHPDMVQFDMRIVQPNARIRYTLEQNWLICKGVNVRKFHFGQYRDLCKLIIQSHYYSGQDFSAGDKYISDCANGDASTGNLTTWVWVDTNHHIERVVYDLSNRGD